MLIYSKKMKMGVTCVPDSSCRLTQCAGIYNKTVRVGVMLT